MIRQRQTKLEKKDKRMYENPFNPLVYSFLALGIWFTLEAKRLSNTTSLFSNLNSKEDAPGNKYTSGLSKLSRDNISAVDNFIQRDHANAHGG